MKHWRGVLVGLAGVGLVLLGMRMVVGSDHRTNIVGDDKDEHGCIGSAGYTWCEAKGKCLREWEEPCAQEAAFTLLQHIKLTSHLPFSGIQPGEFTIPPSQGGWVLEGKVMDLSEGGEGQVEMIGKYLEERGLSKAETVNKYTIYRNNELVCMVDWEQGLRVVCAEVGK